MEENTLLQKGDIIQLERGMTVYAEVPEYAVRPSRPFFTKPIRTIITIGQVFSPKKIDAEALLTAEVYNFLCSKIEHVDFKDVRNFMDSFNLAEAYPQNDFDTSIYEGKYIVNSCYLEGGSVHEGYPDGWHVYCTRMDNALLHVDFYQTGYFTGSIKDIKPLSKKS